MDKRTKILQDSQMVCVGCAQVKESIILLMSVHILVMIIITIVIMTMM